MKSLRLLIPVFLLYFLLSGYSLAPAADQPAVSSRWKITTIRVCRDQLGYLSPHVQALGRYPVYSFFIPRPVWTVNGTVVEAQPVYDRGTLSGFRLLGATSLLRSREQNTIKFSLPDQNASKTFFYDQNKPALATCFDFF